MPARQTQCLPPTPLRRSGGAFKFLFAIVSLLCCAASAAGFGVFSVSERAQAGDTIIIYGDGFDGTTQVFGAAVDNDGVSGAPIAFQLGQMNSTCIQAKVPVSMPGRLWKVWVQSSTATSGKLTVNRARPYLLDSVDAAPGCPIRIFGRNMTALGSGSETPQVRLQLVRLFTSGPSPTPINSYLPATVLAATPYCLTFEVPSDVLAGGVYKVLVRNGPGGAAGEVAAVQQVVAMAPHADSLGLGFNWATAITFAGNVYNVRSDPRISLHASGNGVQNDAPAIRGAIKAASLDGGGVVYLPLGTYQSDDGIEVTIPSNVILKGDGPGVSVMNFGYRFTPLNPAGGDGPWMSFDFGDLSGVMDLSLSNKNTGPIPNQTISHHSYSYPHAHRYFFSNLNIDLGNGAAINVNDTYNGVMQNCFVTTQNRMPGTHPGPILLQDIDQWIIRDNTFNYSIDRINLLGSMHTVFEGNTVSRANQYNYIAESGGIETSFSQDIVVQNNTIQGTGPISLRTIDGELIMTQKSIIADLDFVGSVVSATRRTVTCSTNLPSTFVLSNISHAARNFIRITSGKGVGQWRFITASNANTVYVNSSWTEIPDATSTFNISSFCNYQQMILNNYLTNGGLGGVVWWDGACDSVCDGNTLVDTGRILLRCPDYAYTGSPGSNRRHCAGWNDTISNNLIKNTNGYHMAQIQVTALNIGPNSYGSLVEGIEVRNNTLISTIPTVIPDELGSTEGIWNTVVFEGYYTASSPTDNLATMFQGNVYTGAGVGFNDIGTAMTVNGP